MEKEERERASWATVAIAVSGLLSLFAARPATSATTPGGLANPRDPAPPWSFATAGGSEAPQSVEDPGTVEARCSVEAPFINQWPACIAGRIVVSSGVGLTLFSRSLWPRNPFNKDQKPARSCAGSTERETTRVCVSSVGLTADWEVSILATFTHYGMHPVGQPDGSWPQGFSETPPCANLTRIPF